MSSSEFRGFTPSGVNCLFSHKLADFKVAIENIAPGKKADELRTHLTKLIHQSENHLAFLEQKIVRVTEEMNKVIEREEAKTN